MLFRSITNTTQVGSIAIANGGDRYDLNYGGVKWWNGPDEDLGYVIVHPTSGGTQPNPDNTSAYLGFWRSKLKTDSSFISLVNAVFKQNFNNTTSCTSYLSTNNYWTSFVSSSIVTSGLIMNWDIQNSSSYSGVGSTINPTLVSETMRLTSSGNLGIGTKNPTSKLHVAGNSMMDDTNPTIGKE